MPIKILSTGSVATPPIKASITIDETKSASTASSYGADDSSSSDAVVKDGVKDGAENGDGHLDDVTVKVVAENSAKSDTASDSVIITKEHSAAEKKDMKKEVESANEEEGEKGDAKKTGEDAKEEVTKNIVEDGGGERIIKQEDVAPILGNNAVDKLFR